MKAFRPFLLNPLLSSFGYAGAHRTRVSTQEATLDDLIEAWLRAPAFHLALSFPAVLEARFEADTRADRARTMMIFGLLGFAFGTLLYPVIRADMPDIASQVRHLYLEGAMPLGFALSAALWFNPRPPVREGMVLLANLVCIGVAMYLFAVSRSASAPLFVAGVVVLMVYSAIGIQLRFGYALAAIAIIVAAYAVALHAHAAFTPPEQLNMIAVCAVTGAYLLLANWRLEREFRRSYLLMLRERLQRHNLSVQNVELDELSRRDALTGLANRRAYDAWLDAAFSQQGGTDLRRLGLIVIDVDRFKAFNDFYGHAAGDGCLKSIALCLRDQLRGTSDLVARLGGEEFAVLLPALSEDLCADVAERIRLAVEALELPHQGLGPHGLVTVSFGVASHAIEPGGSAPALFEAADAALYHAKSTGRNRVCLATVAPQKQAALF